MLALQRRGFRAVEAAIAALVGVVALSFVAQLAWAHPSVSALVIDAIPNPRLFKDGDFVYLAVGIVGATVMPHNLYLHSALVQTRRHDKTARGTRQAIRTASPIDLPDEWPKASRMPSPMRCSPTWAATRHRGSISAVRYADPI